MHIATLSRETKIYSSTKCERMRIHTIELTNLSMPPTTQQVFVLSTAYSSLYFTNTAAAYKCPVIHGFTVKSTPAAILFISSNKSSS